MTIAGEARDLSSRNRTDLAETDLNLVIGDLDIDLALRRFLDLQLQPASQLALTLEILKNLIGQMLN